MYWTKIYVYNYRIIGKGLLTDIQELKQKITAKMAKIKWHEES